MNKYIILIILVIITILLSSSAAFFSVYGLSKLFAGASFAVIIMASVLELAKLVVAYILHQKANLFPKTLKIYLASAVIVLMIITSAGIYGFLSNAYQITANKGKIYDKQIEIETKKLDNLKSKLDLQTEEKNNIIKDINQLRSGLTTGTTIQYVDKSGEKITTTSSKTRESFENQLNDAINRRDQISISSDKLISLIDSIEINILNLNSNNDVAAELGPLIYLSNLTSISMDRIINYFILMIIFVFDPLAVCCVITISYLTKPTRGRPRKRKINVNNKEVKINTEVKKKLSRKTKKDQ